MNTRTGISAKTEFVSAAAKPRKPNAEPPEPVDGDHTAPGDEEQEHAPLPKRVTLRERTIEK